MYRNILKYRTINAPDSDSEEEDMGRGQRAREQVCYDEDTVTEKQWVDACDNEENLDELEQRGVSAKHGAGKKKISRANGIKKISTSRKEQKTSLNNVLMQLRKVCNHPYLFEEADPGQTNDAIVSDAGKMAVMDRLLMKLFARGHKVLIFSQMTKMLSIIEDYLIHRNFAYCRIDGGTKLEDRQLQMDDFNNNPAMMCFLLSTRAGGLGINLVSADTVVIFDSDWNPQADLQAQDRCHRIGQKKPVLVYRLCAANSVEEQMLEKAAAKRKLEHLIVSNGKFTEAGATSKKEDIQQLTQEDLLKLLEDNYSDETVSKGILTEEDIEALLDRTSLFRIAPGQVKVQINEKFKVLDEEAAEDVTF